MINWKQKLSSRKFWAALIGFIAPLLVIFNVPDIAIEQITALITACSGLAVYILAESYVDGLRAKNNQ